MCRACGGELKKESGYHVVRWCPVFDGRSIPRDGITRLMVVSCPMFIGNALPSTITVLTVVRCPLFDGKSLPPGLSSLAVDDCPLFDGTHLPFGLERLNVYMCPMFDGHSIPHSLNSLRVNMCPLFDGRFLPPNLNALGVLNCPRFISLEYTLPKLTYVCVQFPFHLKEYLGKCRDLENLNSTMQKRPLIDDIWSVVRAYIL